MAHDMRSKMGKRFSERNCTMFLFVLPTIILYCVFSVYPIISGFFYSLTDWNGLTAKYNFVGLKNYANILTDARFQKAIWFNIRYSLMLLAGTIAISLMLALLLNSNIRLRSFFRGVYFFPAVISMLTAGLIFNEIYFRAVPLLGEALNIGFLKSSILANAKTAIFGILLVHLWQGVAMPTVLLLAGLQSVPLELYESASIDGASKLKQFMHITMPFLLPVLTVVFVLVFKDGLTVYDYIMALTTGGPGGATESVSLLIYNHGFKEIKFSYSIAEAVILCVLVCSISYIQISFSNKKKVY